MLNSQVLIIVSFMQGQLLEAEKALASAIKLSPSHARAHFELSNVYRRAGREEEAKRLHTIATQLDSSLAKAATA